MSQLGLVFFPEWTLKTLLLKASDTVDKLSSSSCQAVWSSMRTFAKIFLLKARRHSTDSNVLAQASLGKHNTIKMSTKVTKASRPME
jgi:hypothetical protein